MKVAILWRNLVFIVVTILMVGNLSIIEAAAVDLPDTNKVTLSMNPNAIVRVYQTDKPDYYQYINGRFAFLINFPIELSTVMQARNNDGAIFSTPDKQVQLSVWGSHNNQRDSINDVYRERIRQNENIAYKICGDDWYVISWAKNGKIYFEKGFISDEYRNVFTLIYPEDMKEKFDSVTTVIEESFIPGWKSGRKIWG